MISGPGSSTDKGGSIPHVPGSLKQPHREIFPLAECRMDPVLALRKREDMESWVQGSDPTEFTYHLCCS